MCDSMQRCTGEAPPVFLYNFMPFYRYSQRGALGGARATAMPCYFGLAGVIVSERRRVGMCVVASFNVATQSVLGKKRATIQIANAQR